MDRKVKLNGVAITGQTLLYTKIPNLILGDDAGYQRGDILDANAVALKINEVIGGAPEALDTLKELADAMQDNPQLITDMKNQIDPFFTPNQNNKIDTYDELKAFFNDTPPVYTYTKRETDPKPWRNMSYYNHNYRTTTLSSFIVEKLLQYGRGWVELTKDGLTYSGFCTVCPNGTIEYEYEMDIEGTTNRLCFEVDSIESGGKLYGEIPLEDGFVCDLYTVTQEVHFETFEERMNGKVDVTHVWSGTDSSASFNYDEDLKKLTITNNSSGDNAGIRIASKNTNVSGETANISGTSLNMSGSNVTISSSQGMTISSSRGSIAFNSSASTQPAIYISSAVGQTTFYSQPTTPALYPIIVNNNWQGVCGLGTGSTNYIAEGWIARPLMNVLSGRVFMATSLTISDAYNGQFDIDTGALCLSIPNSSSVAFELNSTLENGVWTEINLTDFINYCNTRLIYFMVIVGNLTYSIIRVPGNNGFYVNNTYKPITKVEYKSNSGRKTTLRFTFSDL